MKVETYSIKGKSFENEDFLLWQDLGGNKLVAVVADGMGGMDAGLLAARTAGETIVATPKQAKRHQKVQKPHPKIWWARVG